MNVFEDLIVELKEENLLEETVFDTKKDELADAPFQFEPPISERAQEAAESEIVRNDEIPVGDVKPKKMKPAKGSREFFKKRAVAEVSSLQMVEHVLTAIEREYRKVKPTAFDDFNVKKALNTFLQVPDSDDAQQKSAEFALMQQTEGWNMALAVRDSGISVQNLRLYCENTRPALSSQAMLALAKFYRNSPYSEAVRAKFDFVITRLFSKPIAGEKRVPLFERGEALGHINKLYGEWSSISLYTADDDASKVTLTALSFDDLTAEAENAACFDVLIESDFFGRLRLFKESISELFFAPEVAIAAIEANIAIGNAYVKLIDQERKKADADVIQTKYGDIDDEEISDAAARTLGLTELLRSPVVEEEKFEESGIDDGDKAYQKTASDAREAAAEPKRKVKFELPAFVEGLKQSVSRVNKWLLIVSVVLIVASAGFYIWTNYFVEEKITTSGVTAVNLDNAVFKEHLKTAKISGETFYGVLLPSWETLPKAKREEYVKKILDAGPSMNFKQVNLLKSDGKHAAFANSTRVDVTIP